MKRRLPLLLLAATGCSAGFQPLDYPSPVALMEVSETLFRRGKWADAALGFRQLTFQLPTRDSIALRARFMLAETDYAQGNFLEAARQFRRVVDEAPSNRLAPNALLRSGDAQAALWKRPELDPTYGNAAEATYRELLARYPETQAARRASLRIQELAAMQAEKSFKNGEFYFKIKAYDSAVLYYKSVVANHAESRYAVRSLNRLVQIYERLQYEEERNEMCTHLRRYYADAEGLDDRCPVTSGS